MNSGMCLLSGCLPATYAPRAVAGSGGDAARVSSASRSPRSSRAAASDSVASTSHASARACGKRSQNSTAIASAVRASAARARTTDASTPISQTSDAPAPSPRRASGRARGRRRDAPSWRSRSMTSETTFAVAHARRSPPSAAPPRSVSETAVGPAASSSRGVSGAKRSSGNRSVGGEEVVLSSRRTRSSPAARRSSAAIASVVARVVFVLYLMALHLWTFVLVAMSTGSSSGCPGPCVGHNIVIRLKDLIEVARGRGRDANYGGLEIWSELTSGEVRGSAQKHLHACLLPTEPSGAWQDFEMWLQLVARNKDSVYIMYAPIFEEHVTSDVHKEIGTLRKHMVQKQRIIGHQHPRLVTEGRDQGSVAFPNAPVKFYLDADPKVRAARRAAQLREAGHEVDDAELLESIIERDRIDSTRADGPLTCPEDAIIVDTSDLDIDGVVETLAAHAADILARLEARNG